MSPTPSPCVYKEQKQEAQLEAVSQWPEKETAVLSKINPLENYLSTTDF